MSRLSILSLAAMEEEKGNGTRSNSSATPSIIHDAEHESTARGLHNYWRIFTYTDRTAWMLNGLALVFAICSGAMLPLMNLVFGKFVNSFTRFASSELNAVSLRNENAKLAMWLVYLFFAKFISSYIWTMAVSISALRTTKALRIRFLERVLQQDSSFFELQDRGSVAIQLSTNGNLVNQGISEKLGLLVQGFSTLITAFIVGFLSQWKLTLITLSIIPPIIIVMSVCVSFITKIQIKILPLYAQAGELAEEAISSIGNVHAFWAYKKMGSLYESYLSRARSEGKRFSPFFALLFSVQNFCNYAGYALAFWQGARMYARGDITQPGDIVTSLLTVVLAATALTSIAPQLLQISQAASAAHGLFTVIDKQIENDEQMGQIPDAITADIVFQDVEFSYPARPDVPIFEKFNLSIPLGKTTALVGPSGSGKSTVIGLLERWYSPKGGTISIGSTLIQNLNVKWLRSNIRVVQQEPVLFDGTIEENVRLGLLGTDGASLPEAEQLLLIRHACETAFADEFIQSLPEGYQTYIGQRGSRLSGGQKQRIAIARSIVSDPQILLLDEATSALDPNAEKIVQEALENVSKNRTTLVIAHKLSTVRKADNIAVLTNGIVSEQGTHEQLLKLGAKYARLVEIQTLDDGGERADSEDPGIEHEILPTILSNSSSQTSLRGSNLSPDMDVNVKASMGFNLLHCLAILIRELPELWLCFILALFVCLVAGSTYVALALIFSHMISVFQLPLPAINEKAQFYALMFFVLALSNLFCYSALGVIANIISQALTYKYRLELFQNTIRQDRAFFDRPENNVGAIVSGLSTKPQWMQELLGYNILQILVGTVSVVSSCILAIAVNWKLGLVVVFGSLPVILFAGFLRIRLEIKVHEDVEVRFATSTAFAAEAVSAIRTVSSLTLETYVLEQYKNQLQKIDSTSTKSFLWTMLWYSLCSSINFLGMALGFWYGTRLLSENQISTIGFYTCFVAVIFSGESAAQLFSFATSVTKGHSAINYMFWLRSLKSLTKDQDHGKKFKETRDAGNAAALVCDRVQFAYPQRPSQRIIDNIGFDIPSGTSIAFVGSSGCGKSTLISLLERFYDPDAGRIYFNGRDICRLNPQQYRHQIALVEQEPRLYKMSIHENIALGLARSVSQEEVETACQAANIFDFIVSLPDGFNTLCGSNGAQLSGGQKQRIAIARALIRNPKLLLLDEATSALDSESEKQVQAALQGASSGRTTITVAHRLSTIKDADRILVLRAGKVVEFGRHEQLLQNRGVYYSMCLAQSLDRAV